jgi:formylglycine-generating enzyme required for sulfatase activity
MGVDPEKSLSDEATFAGQSKRQRPDVSLGDERTIGGGEATGIDTVIDDIEVVDLEARYTIEGTLGQGGMGAVLLATDTRLDRKVAIKRILGEAAGNRMAVQRFLTEAKAIAALNHPNIVQIYDYGRAKDGPFLIMEYVGGGSLLDRCRESALPLDEAIELACQLCDGLATAHDLGIIHRDIKPANVLLTKDGIPKLTDFGLAKAQASDHGQTMTGAVLGTPDFMPPEQRRDASMVDHRSDLWSLAATIYQMVTGRSPKIIRFDLLPAELTKVLGKALEDGKEARYQSARELRDALKTSLRSASATDSELGEGQCPACGVKNESSRRFCRGCGESLEVPCLSCAKPMPMWEEICGSCGTKQSSLLAERRQAMAASQAEAEGLLGDFDFDGATAVAQRLAEEPHPKLQQLSSWVRTFLGQIEQSKAEQTQHAVDAMLEAGMHEAAHDYQAASTALLAIPESLRAVALPGMREPAAATLARVKKTQAEAKHLETVLKERLAAKQLDDLLPIVEKFLALRPDRADVSKIRTQLLERQSKQATARDEALAKAHQRFAAHDYAATAALLDGIPRSVETSATTNLRRQAIENAKRLRDLAPRIRSALAAKQHEGLLADVEEYYRLKPDDPEIARLARVLRDRETKAHSEVASLTERAHQLREKCDFAQASATLLKIPESRRTPANTLAIAECSRLAQARAAVLAAAQAATQERTGDLLEKAFDYCRQLELLSIKDKEIESLVTEIRGRTRRVRAASQRRQAIIVSALSAVLVVGGAAGAWRLVSWSRGTWRPGTIVNGIGMELVAIKAGEWRQRHMRRDKEGNRIYNFISSIIEEPFHIGRTEVTQREWQDVMSTTPWEGQANTLSSPEQPATYISREAAVEFCELLTRKERAKGAIDHTTAYRLPERLEWSYAASGGASSKYHHGDDPAGLDGYEWFRANSQGSSSDHPSDVARKRANRWGLCDTVGNVSEICSDGVFGACWRDPVEACAIKKAAESRGNGDGDAQTGFRVVLGPAAK